MATLLYRGHTYEHKTSAQSPDITLSYKREHFKKATLQTSKELKKTLKYRGLEYIRTVDEKGGHEPKNLTYRGVTYVK